MPTSRNRSKGPSLRESLRRRFQSGMADRVSNRELRRQAKGALVSGYRAYSTLLAVLAQKGGEVVVTQGTIDQVGQNYAYLGYVVVPNEGHPGEFVIRMTEGKAETEPVHDHGTESAPETVITRVEETPDAV